MLDSNTTGFQNTAHGFHALFSNATGSDNIALGYNAGFNLTTGDNNIDIGNAGVAGEANTIRIGTQGTQTRTFVAGISGAGVSGSAVKVNAAGQLGTAPSSERFKDAIKPMDKASEAILALKPVSFRYKKEIDPDGTAQFGLLAEDVAKVNPALVDRRPDGKLYSVRYDEVNAMLLNEFLKEHKSVVAQRSKIDQQQATMAELESTVARQQKGMEALAVQLKEQAAQIQKVAAHVEVSKRTQRMAANDP